MKNLKFYLTSFLLLIKLSASASDLLFPPDSVRTTTLFTLENKNVNQIYEKTMSLKSSQDFDKAYYQNYLIDDKVITIANNFSYNNGYNGAIDITEKPIGLLHDVTYKSVDNSFSYYYVNANEMRGDSQLTASLRINIGDISTKTKYPYLKFKYRVQGKEEYGNSCYKTMRVFDVFNYYIFSGFIEVSNNSILNIPHVENMDSLGNFFKISPLVDTSIFSRYINPFRSDNIFTHSIHPTWKINVTNPNYVDIGNYIFDTIIPLWKNANLKNLDIVIRGASIKLLDDIKIIGIDTGNFTGISEIDIKNDISFSNSKFIATPHLQSKINNIKVFNMSGQLIMEGGLNEAFPLNTNTLYFCLFNNSFTKKLFIKE